MARFAFPDLVRAFREGEGFGADRIRVCALGSLVLPTGSLVACDPNFLLLHPEPAFTRQVEPGSYPVLLSILSHSGPHGPVETVACASVRFRDLPIERWEMALRPEWDVATLQPGQFFGYGVDGGRGCFVDALAVARLAPAQRQFAKALSGFSPLSLADFLAAIPTALKPLYYGSADDPPLPGQARVATLDPDSGVNVVSFTSGMGDGVYASYFGLAADGSAVCLVTDFGLLVHAVMGKLELPVPVAKRSELTHPDLAAIGIEKIRVTWDRARQRITFRSGKSPSLESLRFENRPGQGLSCTIQRDRTWYDLDEPLQPTARLLLEFVVRTEAL
jgi:hypothetical protein